MGKVSVVENGVLTDKGYLVSPDNPEWLEWADSRKSFRYEPSEVDKGFTVRKEKTGYWIGYRKISGKLHKKHIGKTEDITLELLEQAAKELDKPRQPKQKAATTSSNYVTEEEVTELREELQALREEVQALVKLKAR